MKKTLNLAELEEEVRREFLRYLRLEGEHPRENAKKLQELKDKRSGYATEPERESVPAHQLERFAGHVGR